jgi:hypothetical protein
MTESRHNGGHGQPLQASEARVAGDRDPTGPEPWCPLALRRRCEDGVPVAAGRAWRCRRAPTRVRSRPQRVPMQLLPRLAHGKKRWSRRLSRRVATTTKPQHNPRLIDDHAVHPCSIRGGGRATHDDSRWMPPRSRIRASDLRRHDLGFQSSLQQICQLPKPRAKPRRLSLTEHSSRVEGPLGRPDSRAWRCTGTDARDRRVRPFGPRTDSQEPR